MTPFENYLISIGYKRCRQMGSPKRGYHFEDSPEGYSFSKMEPGRLSYFYIKGENVIEFGLHEYQKPPTLIWPKPKGCFMDDDMNRMLKEKTPEEIYKLLPL